MDLANKERRTLNHEGERARNSRQRYKSQLTGRDPEL